jgi:prolipoprotein diacylglyceryltransferase
VGEIDIMWYGIGVASGLVVVALSLLRFARRRSARQREIDVGSVSESWLAEHRGRTSDP